MRDSLGRDRLCKEVYDGVTDLLHLDDEHVVDELADRRSRRPLRPVTEAE